MISFTGAPNQYLADDPTIPSAIGRIVAGSLDEEFVSTLYEWDKRAYETQWLQSLEEFVAGGEKAVLITYYVNAKESDNLEWWALYRGKGDIVHVQNHMPWYDQIGAEFSVVEANSFLHDRETVGEDGIAISEWDVPFKEVQMFLDALKRQCR